MRRIFALFLAVALLLQALPALAQQASAPAISPANRASEADVREYVRLFGYRQMLEETGARQLEAIIEVFRQTRADIDPGVLDIIHQELGSELAAATDQAVDEMVGSFSRLLTREDVAYLVAIGRDARMQRVIALQPQLARDMEGIGERLAARVTEKAGPRIEERLRQLKDARPL